MTLTDEKIAELREAFKSEMRLMLPSAAMSLLDEVERARALLRRIEWNGEGGLEAGTCPECSGEAHLHISQSMHLGHKPDCELAALLSGTIPAHSADQK